jgi:Uma2 family endonuclease
MSTVAVLETSMTARELADRVGAIPLSRICWDVPPGTATEEDVHRMRCNEDCLCELLDGVLVEKASSDESSFLAAEVAYLLLTFVRRRRLGWVLGANGFVWLKESRLRAPDVSFARRDQRPNGRPLRVGFANVAPALAAEIASPGDTIEELEEKRTEFLTAGTELFWIIYPERQEIEVSTDAHSHRTLTRDDILDGGDVLPGFSVKVADLFDAADLGPAAP